MEVTDYSAVVEADAAKDATGVYEVGYHLIPSLSESDVEGQASALVVALKKAGGSVIGERAPIKMNLAYALEKKVAGAKRSYNEAYFGWVAFEAPTASLKTIESVFAKEENVLRHLLVTTTGDTVAAVLADPLLDAASVPEELPEVAAEAEAGGVVESVGADSSEEV